jgi:hypothetical protein
MAHWQSAVDHWFATHHGIAAARTLEQLGMSSSTIYRLAQEERLVRVMPGVFRSAQWPFGRSQRLAAACASNDQVFIGFTTACREWGLRGVDDPSIHVLTVHGSSPELPDVVVHRTRRIDPVDIVERPDGIRLTSPPRSLFDAADMLGFRSSRSMLEQMLNEQMCTMGTVIDTVTRLYHPNRPGSLTMRRVISSKPRWERALQSDLELRVLLAIERRGLPRPQPQCPVMLPDGQLIHLDFGWPQWKVGLEVDDPAWHGGVDAARRDARRDRKATSIGWAIARIPRLDVEGDLDDALGDVDATIRLRRRAA